jgi:hypothetical protein
MEQTEHRCPTCDARFVNGELIWSTGKPGKLQDLAGLVCNKLSKGRPCSNPMIGDETGDTWESRAATIAAIFPEQSKSNVLI